MSSWRQRHLARCHDDVDLPGNDGGHRRSAASIGNAECVDFGAVLDDFPDQLGDRSRPGRSVIQGLTGRVRVRDQFLDAVDRNRIGNA